ncbi:MAG: DNRLRE domain-containing protein [bacterium]|nr:DNRLRE domain-containing protein [bacterium]
MKRTVSSRAGLLTLGLLISGGGLAGLFVSMSCTGTNPTPSAVVGPAVAGNAAPTLTILEPTEDNSVGQDETVLITWSDSDKDSAARIAFSLVDTLNVNVVIPLVTDLPENDTSANGLPTAETFGASMSVVPPGSYFIQGTIRDGINAPVVTYATTELSDTARVVLTVTQPGFQPPSQPPVVVVITPRFNLSVSQDDELAISVQPTLNDPAIEFPYDGDSDATLYILLDVDENPTNDNPAIPDPEQIIILREQTLTEGDFDAVDHTESVDLATVPLRPDGRPYFVRATVQDPTNEPVHAYAAGTISVAQAASGTVDLGQIGRTLLGATFRGFNPGSNLGSRMISARDFDADGIDDMLLVARFGNPRNFGNIGEAYLIYGLNQQRFGGAINVNSTSSTVPGVILEAPPVRLATDAAITFISPCGSPHTFTNPRTEGITDVAMVGDLNGDGRPEILVGMPHVDGIFQARDDDPGDDPPELDDTIEIGLTIRQGSSELTIGDNDTFVSNYLSFEDTVIDSQFPNSNFGGSQDLEWDNDGPGEMKWTLIRIRDLLNEIPDDARNIDDLSATLTVRVVNEGDNGTVHECYTPFAESSVTFANFAEGGGEPQDGDGLPGDASDGVDYDEEEIGDLSGGSVGTTEVDITDLVQRLVDGELEGVGNDLLLIVVPAEDGEDNTRARSSEFGSVPDDRPTLTITYNRRSFTGACGCYPDALANNVATEEEEDDEAGLTGIEAQGFVSVIHSDNRDNEGPNINLERLEATTVALELAGQQEFLVDLGGFGPITQRAQADVEGRISGARFQVGLYDWVDTYQLDQPPIEASFGWNVASMPDLDADGLDEIIISAPTNERDIRDLQEGPYFPFATHLTSRVFFGSIIVLTGSDYNDGFWRDKDNDDEGCASIPATDHFRLDDPGSCNLQEPVPRATFIPFDRFEVFAENRNDFLGGGRHAGDFNLDGVPDVLAGAPFNDSPFGDDTGATYVIYGRVPYGDYDLSLADDATQRPPMVRIRGETPGDQIGTRQELVGDINGDRIPDIAIASPWADFAGVARPNCVGDYDCDGNGDQDDLNAAAFEACLGQEVFNETDCEPGDCKVFDYDNDRIITGRDDERVSNSDEEVFECLRDEGENCCPVDNGYVGVIFGGVTLDGDRTMSQVATSDLPGVIFYGTAAGDRAGADVAAAAEVASGGDFNQDGFDDLLIVAPGETRTAATGEEHLGVVYLIFGGPHLTGQQFPLSLVGTDELPGIVFLSPYERGFPNEAPPDHVGFLGDINGDGFADIAIGNTQADFLDETLPQEPGGPGTDPGTGRRPDSGDIYVVYGNNFGSNR